MNSRLKNNVSAFGGVGSFWIKNTEEVEEAPFIRALTRLSLGSSFQSQFTEAVQWLAGEQEVMVENMLWQFKESQILTLNADLNQRVISKAADSATGNVYIAIARPGTPDLSSWTPIFTSQSEETLDALLTASGDFLLWPINFEVNDDTILSLTERKIGYLMPIPYGYTPIVIATENRELVLGLNFEARDGFLLFFEPPSTLFPAHIFVVRSAWKKVRHPHDYVWGVEDI